MDDLLTAPLPPEPSLSLTEVSLIWATFAAMCVIAALLLLWLEKKGRR